MIIQCQSCSRKFIVKDKDIPARGRDVKCGYCSVVWHQMPIVASTKSIKNQLTDRPVKKIEDGPSIDSMKASDGKTYRFLGSQWAQVLPSGKTGLFAKKKIGKELDKLTGRKIESSIDRKKKKVKKELDPSSGDLSNEKRLPDIYKPRDGMGFFGFIFLIIIVGFSIVGILKTFEDDLINYFPEIEFVFEQLDEQLEYLAESVKNMIVIVDDLINSY